MAESCIIFPNVLSSVGADPGRDNAAIGAVAEAGGVDACAGAVSEDAASGAAFVGAGGAAFAA